MGFDMRLVRFRHKGLRLLYADDAVQGISPAHAEKLRNLLFALETAEALDQLARFPGWRLHALKREMKGFWSLTVTGNWRLVFRYDAASNTATDLDLVDDH